MSESIEVRPGGSCSLHERGDDRRILGCSGEDLGGGTSGSGRAEECGAGWRGLGKVT